MIAVSLSWSAVSIVLALKLCRRPSEWPTSCITISLIAWPMNSSGSSSLGSGFFVRPCPCLSLSLCPCRSWAARAVGYVGQGDRGQAEVALEARSGTGRSPGSPRQVLGQLPLEEVLIGRDDLGDHLAGVSLESVQAEQSLGGRLAKAHLRGQDRADHLADGQRGRLRLAVRGGRAADQEGVLLLPVADEAGVEDDVAVDHLAGHAGWPAGTTWRSRRRW